MTKKEDKTATLEDAIAIAAQAHKGEVDKAGAAYILHPLRMMMRLKSEAEMITAILHDVVEDTDWTIEKLREEGFSEEVLAAVECVTNREGESYEKFIERAGKNSIAWRVKIADLEDNMNIQRIGEITPKDLERLEKYHRSWREQLQKHPQSTENKFILNRCPWCAAEIGKIEVRRAKKSGRQAERNFYILGYKKESGTVVLHCL